MDCAREMISYIARAAKQHMHIFKAKAEEKVERAKARTEEEKERASERRKVKEALASMELNQEKAEHEDNKLRSRQAPRHHHRLCASKPATEEGFM